MFSRRPKAPAQAPSSSVSTPAVNAQAVAVAAPDALNIVRERSLRHQLGHQLQGGSGTIVGYDVGDPTNSITGPVRAQAVPSEAMARVSFADSQRFVDQSEIYDLGTTDPEQNAYQAALLARITR